MLSDVYLINNNPPHSGVGRYAFTLHRYLSKMGLKARFIDLHRDLFNSNFHRLGRLGLAWPYHIVKFEIETLRLRIGEGSIVHVTNNGYLAKIIPRLKKSIYGIRIVTTVHDTIPLIYRGLSASFMASAYKKTMYSDYIICASKFTADHLPSYLRSLPHRVIYHGVDHELFRPRDKEKVRKILRLPINRPIILNVGSEEPRKNIPTLLKAFRKVVEKIPRAILVRIGSPERSSLKLIELLGLSGKVLYRRATESEIALYYNAADLLVHPAYYEDFGFPLIEAMASGTPIVAAYAAAIPEIVGNAAILVNPFDIDGLAISIVDLLSSKSLLQDLVERVFNRSPMFSWEKTAAQTIGVYEKLSRS